ncbi:MAG: hypothetical protein ABI921_14775 [Panacibacter sp.]
MKPQITSLIKRNISAAGRKLFVAAIAVTCITASAFANGEAENAKAASNLKKEFANAKNIEWKVTPNFIKATFSWNGQQLEVFYNEAGETIAQSRMINTSSLPLKAQQFIQKKYPDYKITEAIEYNSEENGISYFVSLTKEGTKQILEISVNGEVSQYRP